MEEKPYKSPVIIRVPAGSIEEACVKIARARALRERREEFPTKARPELGMPSKHMGHHPTSGSG